MPGFPDGGPGYAMLFMHPCTMRQGAVLRELVTAVKVELSSPKKVVSDPEKWANRNKVMPLPDMAGTGKSTYLADFMKISTVPSMDLDRATRVCQLSIDGRLQMQQRLIFHLTRYAPSLDVLRQATAALDLEMQAQTDWLEAAYAAGQAVDAAMVLSQEVAFDEFMSAPLHTVGNADGNPSANPSRRLLLGQPQTAPAVVRDVQKKIQELFA